MERFRTRACGLGDAADIAAVVNGAARAGGMRGEFAVGEFEDFLRHEVRDLSTDTLAFFNENQLVGVGLVPLAGGERIELVGAVDPRWRGLGIGRELLGWQLRVAEGRRAQVIAGVDDRASIRLYERFGFSVARYFLEMSAPIVERAVLSLPRTVQSKPLEAFEAFDVYRAHADAFETQERTFAEWKALTVESESFRADLARLAVDGESGAIAGFVLPYDRGSLYIGQVGTAPGHRRRGIATALLSEVLAAAGAAGFTVAALDTDAANPTGAPAVYARAGFVVDQHIVAYQRTAADSRL
ncbi:GNAT family N-acetyltransferase [Dactylosporangium sp. NPDC051541]|uniref:GNAT family N-acetyltransferase n=1 Tax=Dactylosporangium sp. NPDC051541 TaxID=3363977 RepID=UPI00379605B3